MANVKKLIYHERHDEWGWPKFTTTQTENRFALCRASLCFKQKYVLRFKNIYDSPDTIKQYAKLRFLAPELFDLVLSKLNLLPWGGEYVKYKESLEGAFYPFVRCSGHRPIDVGAIWIGTKHDYPLIYVDNMVANWICPYSRGGVIMTEPFAPVGDVISNWKRLADKRWYPSLDLPPMIG